MKKLLAGFVVFLAATCALAEPSDNHVALQETAVWAVTKSNVELLSALLQAGVQIDEPVEPDIGWTLLHLAALYGEQRVAQFLVDNGAIKEVRDVSGRRPIDLAFGEGHPDVCALLAKSAGRERMLGDFPKAVLDEVLQLEFSNEPTFVSLNGTNAPVVISEWLARFWKDVRPASQAELSEGSKDKAGHFQDKTTKLAGRLVDIQISPIEGGYEWSIRFTHGPLSGHGQSGKLTKQYGYWIRTDVEGRDF